METNDANNQPSPAAVPPAPARGPHGIGGIMWLPLLYFAVVLLDPLFNIGAFLFKLVVHGWPQEPENSGLRAVFADALFSTLIIQACNFVMLAIGAQTLNLFVKRSRFFPPLLSALIFLYVMFHFVTLLLRLWMVFGSGGTMSATVLTRLLEIESVLLLLKLSAAIVLTFYLSFSNRVKNTFGRLFVKST